MWQDERIQKLFGIDVPIIQAPMTGPTTVDLAVAVSKAGGLGSLPFNGATPERIRSEVEVFRQRTSGPLNANFFCHTPPRKDAAVEARWREKLRPYYVELGLEENFPIPPTGEPFGAAQCEALETCRPEVVSFHVGLPAADLLARVKATGAKVISSATTVEEARWLEAHGCDAIIAQGLEAGGHRGMFLTDDLATQVGTFALVPQVVDAVRVPVIATGGVGDARGIVAALALGAAAVQLGTAYMFSSEARVPIAHLDALRAKDGYTLITNVFTGRVGRSVPNRLVREVGPLSDAAPDFPLAASDLGPLRAASVSTESDDFIPLWSGQAALLSARQAGLLGIEIPRIEMSAGDLTRHLAKEVLSRLRPDIIGLLKRNAESGWTEPL